MTFEKLITDHIDIWSSALQTRSTAGRGSNGKIDLYGIKKLRELILELAVRGKLVPQDPNDEPASELLKRIAAEKAELVKQGKIKKQKPLPEISEDEKPFELPSGWEWARLQDITSYIQRGKGPTYDENGTVYVVSQKCVQWTGFNLTFARFISDTTISKYGDERFLREHDLLWNSTGTGTAGRIIELPSVSAKRLVADSHVTVIRPLSILSSFLCSYISSFGIQSRIEPDHENTLVSGTTNQVELSNSAVSSLPIPIPPSNEQNKIATTVQSLLSLCDQLEQQSLTSLNAHQQLVETLLSTLTDSQNTEELAENWARISQYFDTLFTTEASIDALKQTILQLAVMGKLVPQDPNDEPAYELLKRIEQEKAQLVKEGKIKKQKPLPPVSDEEKPFALPVGWEWCRIIEIAQVGTGATPSRDNPDYWQHPEFNWVTSGETSLPFIFNTAEKISLKAVKETNVSIYSPGTLIIAMYGQGKTRGQITELCISAGTNQACAAIQLFDTNEYHRRYVKLFFEKSYEDLRNLAAGGAQPNLNLAKVSNTLIPLPPFSEQIKIATKVEELFKVCDTLKSRLQSAQQTQLHLADALTDAALN
ncbi:restriction endonuclease subunit S [Yersinia enterocolitica]|uniref:restriction endonuclease subunit S n=1 Tax=Yersinia enterocolitica TaxID=630 RepID=UPI0029C155D8|nr:restriction endonuclease subunit S [Yersinia enterocolitica]EKN3937707.1 restriction endonuclease subunit S [Yersinia enterocolitica]EKN4872247.1 restriction endonuclease subunit S [Yersinia enterocolitica]EKN5028246.1 restriction endonuclease subunit S [Yersinia enterocolitica]EKN6328067.1 restriction endonuclease subunit S [Yersinia enterocolitica]